MQRPKGFVPLSEVLWPPQLPSVPAASSAAPGVSLLHAGLDVDDLADDAAEAEDEGAAAEALAQARRFSATLADALEDAVARLTEDLATEVLGRELRLAPAGVEALARRLCAEYVAETPVRVRVAAEDRRAAAEGSGLPVLEDAALSHGDVILEVRNGDIRSTLGMRLEDVVAKAGCR